MSYRSRRIRLRLTTSHRLRQRGEASWAARLLTFPWQPATSTSPHGRVVGEDFSPDTKASERSAGRHARHRACRGQTLPLGCSYTTISTRLKRILPTERLLKSFTRQIPKEYEDFRVHFFSRQHSTNFYRPTCAAK